MTGESTLTHTERLARRAGALAEERALRGFDAIHLAAALEALRGVDGEFLCFDERLTRAAKAEGLRPGLGNGAHPEGS